MAKLAELAYEDRGTPNAHVHVASRRRWRLGRIAKKARKFGLAVREFPPYDTIDPVHAQCSWHYRWPGHAGECAPARYGDDRNRKNLAMDCSGYRAQQFFDWVYKTYGRPSAWFQP